MSYKFVSFYLIIVIITTLFFQFVPLPEMLSGQEILLSKILNQAPGLVFFAYLLTQIKRIKRADLFILLMAFLFFNILSESYYYFITDENLLLVSILNNIITYSLLGVIYIKKKVYLAEANKKVLLYASILGLILIIGGSFPLAQAYKEYFTKDKILVITLIIAMSFTIAIVCISFFVDRPLSRSWYKTVIGTILIAMVDIYVYTSIFGFNSPPVFLFTIGKVLFSLGLLLIVDTVVRKCLAKDSQSIFYKNSTVFLQK